MTATDEYGSSYDEPTGWVGWILFAAVFMGIIGAMNAIQGLAHGEEEGARELVKAAFSSPDERLRAAAVGSAAGDSIPE